MTLTCVYQHSTTQSTQVYETADSQNKEISLWLCVDHGRIAHVGYVVPIVALLGVISADEYQHVHATRRTQTLSNQSLVLLVENRIMKFPSHLRRRG